LWAGAIDTIFDQSDIGITQTLAPPSQFVNYSGSSNDIILTGVDTLYFAIDDFSCTGDKTVFLQVIYDGGSTVYQSNTINLPTEPTTTAFSIDTITETEAIDSINFGWSCSSGYPAVYGDVRDTRDPVLVWGTDPSRAVWTYMTGELSPTATPFIDIPDDEQVISQATINALGAQAFYFYVDTNVNASEWEGYQYQYQISIYDETETLFCTMDSLTYSGAGYNSSTYGALLNHKTDGEPEPCQNFTEQIYTAETRVRESGGDWTDWSSPIEFSVGDNTAIFSPVVDCDPDAPIYSLCGLYNLAMFFLTPSEQSINYLWSVIENINNIFPINWIAEIYDIFTDATDVIATDLGTVDAGNILSGDMPNVAWLQQQFKQFYGGWAEVLGAFVLWFSVLIAIIRAGFRLVNINEDMPFE
jgi:hypothetical protein